MSDAGTPDLPGAYVRDVVALVARWDVPAEALLRGLPVSAEALADPGTRVAIPVCAEIVRRAHALTGEPALALYLGMQMRLSTHGFLGFAAMTASTVRDAIALAARFAGTRTSALGLALYVEGDTASLVLEDRAPLGDLREFAVLGLFVGIWQLGQAVTGRSLAGVAECDFPAPAYLARVPFAGTMLRFEQPANRLVFAASVLDLPLTSADPVASQLARAQCERELAALVDAGLVGRVRAALAAPAGRMPSVGEVARALHVSARTLKRRLADRGTTYSAIVDDVRRQRALLLLDDRELSVGEIAARLGYTEVSSFSRAFRKWTGLTPAGYRAR